MKKRITAIILGSIRHSEKSDIVSLYTAEAGRMQALTPANSGRKGRTASRRLIPLSVIEADINCSATRELQQLHSFATLRTWQGIYFNPIKNAIGIFMAEFMSKLLRDSAADPDTWQFILSSLSLLNDLGDSRALSNFHLAFCVRMLGLSGIMPDVRMEDDDSVFDMRAACYSPVRPTHKDIIGGKYAQVPKTVARMNYRNMHLFRLTKTQRDRMLDGILYFYALHLPGMDTLRSPKVLKELFD